MAADNPLGLTAFPSALLFGEACDVAPRLLNAVIVSRIAGVEVGIRIVEVEAYGGVGEDPGSHAYRGKTPRNSSMFRSAGHLYVYRSYGIHWCVNVVTGDEGRAAGVLLRAGEVVLGQDAAYTRRTAAGVVRSPRDLARGPGRFGAALGASAQYDGVALNSAAGVALFEGPAHAVTRIARSTRTGVSGPGAVAALRFHLVGDQFVSPHRPVR